MSDEVDRLLVRVEANAQHFETQMKRVNKALHGSSAQTRQTLDRIKRDTAAAAPQMFASIGSGFRREIASLAPMLAGLFSAQQVVRYADAYTSLQNRLKATGLEGEALKRVEDGLYESANRNGVAVEATASLYQRAAMARQNLGASEEQLMQIVSGTTAALKLQGTSAGEASGALLQLGQLLGGNMVQSQEYNSLIDGLPTVLEAVAKGSERWGGSVNKLTQDVKAGKVSAQEFSQAMLKGFEDIERRAGGSTTTVGAALQTLNNQLGRFIGQTDSSLSATARMAQAIEWLANNLDTVTQVVGVLAAIMGTRFVLSLTASASATLAATIESVRYQVALAGMAARQAGVTTATVLSTGAMRAFSAAVAANPIGAAVVAVAALTAGLVWLKNEYGDAAVAARELDRVTAAADTALDEYRKAMDKARAASGEERKELLKKAQALREVTNARIEDARVAAQGQINEAVAARRAAAEAEARAARNRTGGGSSEGSRSVQFGMDRAAQGAQDFANRSQAQADAAIAGWRSLLSGRDEVDNPTAGGGGGGAGTDDPKKASGSTAAELAAQRLMLRLQGELEILRAQGNEDAIRAKQREIDLINLTKSYTDAGFENASEQARTQIDNLASAEDITRQIDENLEQSARRADRHARTQQYLVEQQQRENDLLMDSLGYEAELARLRGDPVAVRAMERELWIEERINELLRLRPELTAQQRRAQAEGERGALDAAGRQGEDNDRARSMARDFVDVLASDSWAEAAGRKFREAAFDNLEDMLSELFSGLMGNSGAGGGSSIGAMLGSTLKSMIPGFASGTSSAPGGLSYVHKGEVLTNLQKGTSVIPAHAVRAMGRLTAGVQVQSPSRATINPVLKIDLTGANGDQTIRQLAAEAARTAYAQAVTTSQQTIPVQQAQRERYAR